MLPKLPTARKSSLPLLLIASPLLLAAARPVDLDAHQFPCNVPAAEGSVPASYNESQNGDSSGARSETRNEAAADSSDFSGMGGPSLGKRWAIALRLLRANRYTQEDSPATGITHTPATAPTENNCLAQQQPSNETLLAQTTPIDNEAFILTEDIAENIAEEPDLLPVLGAPPARPMPAPVSPPTTAPVSLPTVRPLPRPNPAPIIPPVRSSPVPRPVPPTPSAPPSGFPQTRPSSVDPTNVTPTTVNPTPFDGSTIQTLASRPDGNYRYVSGNVESRSYTDAEIQQRGSAVFMLKKDGNRVTGDLLPGIGLPGICVTGIVSGNTISGTAYPHSAADSPYGSSGALKVKQSRTVTAGEQTSRYYASAILDLSNFSMINAGASLPPETCRIESVSSREPD